MHTATKKLIAGLAILACIVTVVTGVTQEVPFVTVCLRTVAATFAFGLAGFIGGTIYEKLWLK